MAKSAKSDDIKQGLNEPCYTKGAANLHKAQRTARFSNRGRGGIRLRGMGGSYASNPQHIVSQARARNRLWEGHKQRVLYGKTRSRKLRHEQYAKSR